MTEKDPWHYPRIELAHAIITTLSSNVVHSMTLFAPRRMGKTEFLLKDIVPTAENAGFRVFYFSFLDGSDAEVLENFVKALRQFVADSSLVKKGIDKAKRIKSVGGAGFSVELNDKPTDGISGLLNTVAAAGQPILLLLDEIQELANISQAAGIIGSLRTGLDVNRDMIKTIFTGSSRNGLLSMFNDARAPFFHFSNNLDFPTLDDGFVTHLAKIYTSVTKETLDEAALIEAFNQLGRVPSHLRTLVQNVIIDPAHALSPALEKLKNSIEQTRDYSGLWRELKGLDRAIIQHIANGGEELYASATRAKYANLIGVKNLSVATVQNAIRRLQRQNHLSKNALGDYVLNEPNFMMWVQNNSHEPTITNE